MIIIIMNLYESRIQYETAKSVQCEAFMYKSNIAIVWKTGRVLDLEFCKNGFHLKRIICLWNHEPVECTFMNEFSRKHNPSMQHVACSLSRFLNVWFVWQV